MASLIRYHGEAVNAFGVPIAYPPLHMHHIHIGRSFPSPPSGTGLTLHWFETHGDYGVGPSGVQPGTRVAEGYCDVLAPLRTFGDGQVSGERLVNDVRFTSDTAMRSDGKSELTAGGGQGGGQALKAAAAPEIEWYMRLYFRMSAAPCKLANKLILWHPVDAVVSLEKLVRFPMGAAPEVRWWTTRLRRGGTILSETWVHSHRGRYGGCLVVAGRHSLWSLAGMPMTARDQAMPTTAPSWSIGSASELRAHLALRAEAAGTLVCHDVAEEPVFLRLPPAADGSGGYHDRAGRFVCETGRHFEAEEEWTVFFFSTPNFSPKMRMYMQHMLVMLRYAPDAPLRTSIVDEVFPTEYGKWELGAPMFEVCLVSNATCTARPTGLPKSTWRSS